MMRARALGHIDAQMGSPRSCMDGTPKGAQMGPTSRVGRAPLRARWGPHTSPPRCPSGEKTHVCFVHIAHPKRRSAGFLPLLFAEPRRRPTHILHAIKSLQVNYAYSNLFVEEGLRTSSLKFRCDSHPASRHPSRSGGRRRVACNALGVSKMNPAAVVQDSALHMVAAGHPPR